MRFNLHDKIFLASGVRVYLIPGTGLRFFFIDASIAFLLCLTLLVAEGFRQDVQATEVVSHPIGGRGRVS